MTPLPELGPADAVGDGDCSDPTSVVLHVPQFLKKLKSSSTSSSTSLFDNLTEEELIEILRRLPLKLATRCKSLSKTFLNLISTRHFSTAYLQSYHAPPQFAIINRYYGIIGQGLFRETPSSETLIQLTPLMDLLPAYINPLVDTQFLAASKGWVLCLCPDLLLGECYYVVNPLTRNRITLPRIGRAPNELYRFGFTLCAGNDEINATFRVVRLSIPDGGSVKLDIFCSETRDWTVSTVSFASPRSAKRSDVYDCPLNYHGVAFDGKLHWLHVWFENEIFVFDPYDQTGKYQEYRRLSLPRDCEGASRYCFGTCQCKGQERKHLKYAEWNKGLIRVWELEDYDKAEWSLLHRVHVSEITSLVYGLPRVDWPPVSLSLTFLPDVVGFHPWDRDLVLCHESRRFLQYNLRMKTLEVLMEQGRELKPGVGMTRAYFLLELPWWPTPIP